MILVSYGTRPEYLKVKPVIDELKSRGIPYRTLYVKQHQGLPDGTNNIVVYDYGGRLDSIIGSVMSAFHHIYDHNRPDVVVVQGDTTSALAVALAANNMGLHVAHLEAGLRTYDNDNPWPEEGNRKMISAIARTHFCPTINNKRNLEFEKACGNILVTGNTSIDALVDRQRGNIYSNKVLVTMHRRENIPLIRTWFKKIEDIANAYGYIEFTLPIHPNPEVQRHRDVFKEVSVIDPMSHNDLLNLLQECRLVITDSGGLQEECSYFNKKCLVCREATERPEALGRSSILVQDPEDLFEVFHDNVEDCVIRHECPFGDGHAAERVVNELEKI